MARAAIRDDDVDAVLKLHDLAAAIVGLARGKVHPDPLTASPA
jgi:hypothetical protein